MEPATLLKTPEVKLAPLRRAIIRFHPGVGAREADVLTEMLFKEAHDPSFRQYRYRDVIDFVRRRMNDWGYLRYNHAPHFNPVNAVRLDDPEEVYE